jgi:hypothetical protein
MLNQEKTKIIPTKGHGHRPMPNLWKYKQDEHSYLMHWDITLRLLKRFTRLLGRYSLETEGKLANDIIHLIENEIKTGSENKLMRELYSHKVKMDSTAYRKIYFATKTIMLTFGKLMQEGSIEHQAKGGTHLKKEESILWVLRLELRLLSRLAADNYNDTVPSEITDELKKYICMLCEDIDKFEKAHKFRHTFHNMNPEASKTSAE